MPIVITHPVKPLSEQAFHNLDYQVMKLAFEAHNELGRLYDEKIYQNKLRTLCQKSGIQVECEVEIKLTHSHFTKSLFIDQLVESSAGYELKTAQSIHTSHRTQALGYLFLTNTQHGKIINFRPPSVEHVFVSTALTHDKRRNISISDSNWNKSSPAAERLKITIVNLLMDWGAFLNTNLYKEAVCCLLGEGKDIIQPIEIESGNNALGQQNVPLLNQNESFCISSIRNETNTYRTHLERFLQHTSLKYLHWININNQIIQFTTLHS